MPSVSAKNRLRTLFEKLARQMSAERELPVEEWNSFYRRRAGLAVRMCRASVDIHLARDSSRRVSLVQSWRRRAAARTAVSSIARHPLLGRPPKALNPHPLAVGWARESAMVVAPDRQDILWEAWDGRL